MPANNQDFVTYQGDAPKPIFTVRDSAGAIVDISTVTEIEWTCRRMDDDVAALTKLKSAGAITFVTNGTDGKFQVAITIANTTGLNGFYKHQARITDSAGNPTTVSAGRMQVGPRPSWTYDASAVADVPLYQVRLLVGDVLANDQQLSDPEILFAIGGYSNTSLAAAQCARNIAIRLARQVDISEGNLRKNYSERSKQYAALARDLESRGMAIGGASVYAGGISQADKTAQLQDLDRVTPQFNLMMDDNLIVPVGPVGNETPGNPASTGSEITQ